MTKDIIQKEIVRLKSQLGKLYEERGCTDQDVLKVSLEIDDLLIKLWRFEELF